jgi:hypothetical protein
VDEVEFGRYRLLSVIGEGGMGKVYRAHDTLMDRDVAIKVLPHELATEPGYELRFRREARTAARITEPHIIPVYESGELLQPTVHGQRARHRYARHGGERGAGRQHQRHPERHANQPCKQLGHLSAGPDRGQQRRHRRPGVQCQPIGRRRGQRRASDRRQNAQSAVTASGRLLDTAAHLKTEAKWGFTR